MDFALTAEQELVRDAAREVAEREIEAYLGGEIDDAAA
jgi:hypothetical protein